MTHARILVIEDDVALGQTLMRRLTQAGHEAARAASGAEARAMLDAQAPHLVLLDLSLPDLSRPPAQEPGLLQEIAACRPTVVLTDGEAADAAAQALRAGAVDCIQKPVNLDELEFAIHRALGFSRLRAAHALVQARSTAVRTRQLLRDAPGLAEMWQRIHAVAATQTPVLVTGEDGVGKALVARAMHQASSQRAEAFVAVDCTALQDAPLESELFGQECVNAAGADAPQPGLVEAAAGGTLFLADIGRLGPRVQARLLRLLETGRYRRVGGTADRLAEVRVVASTHTDLPAAAAAGRFCAELCARLAASSIAVPPLRARRGDIPQLVPHLAAQHTRGAEPPTVAPAAMQHLLEYDWPGNVRELNNVIERALLLAGPQAQIEPRHLPLLDASATPPALPAPAASPAGQTDASRRTGLAVMLAALCQHHEPTLEEIERSYLALLLARYAGNRRMVSQVMGVSERTAYRMLDRYGLK